MGAPFAVKRKLCYVTGTRADFGLIRRTLMGIHQSPILELSLVVTGMHLLPKYGSTVKEIESTGLPIRCRIPVDLSETTGASMAKGLAVQLDKMVDCFAADRPDIVVVLGDRAEMLAAALAAIHLDIPVVHIHGGERSGSVDEVIRHAISKIAHYHFTATQQSRDRLIRMGEDPNRVFVTGTPGLDGIEELAVETREELCALENLDPSRPVVLVVFHPVVQEASEAREQALVLCDAIERSGVQAVWVLPNSDAGGDDIRAVVHGRSLPLVRLHTHIPRSRFVSWMAVVDAMVGNSSSGIIEAGTFGTPVVNVGIRQRDRERGPNVIDVEVDVQEIYEALEGALGRGRLAPHNIYGDGRATERIIKLLQELPLSRGLMNKVNAY